MIDSGFPLKNRMIRFFSANEVKSVKNLYPAGLPVGRDPGSIDKP